jgi:hypothetical protein
MAAFKPGVEVVLKGPSVVVQSPLDPGTYVYQLVVEDNFGNLSQPAKATVTIT